jgi:hypothetical protein
MEARDTRLLELRGESYGTINNQSSSEEIFQNKTLRPILKMQNDLFIQVFINYAIKQKNVFFSLTPEKKNGLYRKRYSTRYKVQKLTKRYDNSAFYVR